eukprot:3640143-Amphidinium_carterae.1
MDTGSDSAAAESDQPMPSAAEHEILVEIRSGVLEGAAEARAADERAHLQARAEHLVQCTVGAPTVPRPSQDVRKVTDVMNTCSTKYTHVAQRVREWIKILRAIIECAQ